MRSAGAIALSARETERTVRALCTRPDCYSALCCALFGLLYMDIVKKKKEFKNDPRGLGRHS